MYTRFVHLRASKPQSHSTTSGGFMLLVIIFYGPGALSIDGLLARRSGYVTRDSY